MRSIPLAGTGRMISTGEASGQGQETYGLSSPVHEGGQSKLVVAEANETGLIIRTAKKNRRPYSRSEERVQCYVFDGPGRDAIL